MKNLVLCVAITTLLASHLTAQNFTATMDANQALELDFSGASTQPAGPLNGNVSLVRQSPLNPSVIARLDVVVPTPTNLSCRITTSLDTGIWTGSFFPAIYRSDTTLWVSGPAGTWGTVEIVLLATDNPLPTVDVGDDGTIDNPYGQFYGGLSSGLQTRSWSVPAMLTSAPLPIRIVHPTHGRTSSFYQQINVRFVPWSPNATDLGSSCSENHTGWIVGENENRTYALDVRPGTGGAAATLHARGHGPLQAFVLASQPSRLPTGLIPLGIGCDDLFTNVVTMAPGVPAPFTSDSEWTLDVPVLPPGLVFYLQHASYDPVFGSSVPEGYFGVTNAVRYQT